MAAETARPTLDRRELYRRLIGRKVELSTVCGTFSKANGTIKEVFEDFLMFITTQEIGATQEQLRNWVLFDAVTVVTESPKAVVTEEIEITR